MTVSAITALTFHKLKQITIKELLGVGNKHAASRSFFATARMLLYFVLD